MSPSYWSLNRLAAGIDDPIQVAILPDSLLKKLGWQLGYVYLSQVSAKHIRKDHPEIGAYEVSRIPEFIESGLIVQDKIKSNVLTISYYCPKFLRRYTLSLKRTADGSEIYVTSLFLTRERQVRRHIERGTIVRKHK